MPFSLKLTGHEGTVRWGYLPAVTFGPWRFEGDTSEGTFVSQVVSRDEYRLQQSPLVVTVSVGRATWRWLVTDLQFNGTELVARAVRQ